MRAGLRDGWGPAYLAEVARVSATSIEWTDVTWNPTRGCSRVSEGCRNCYAERIAARFSRSKGYAIAPSSERSAIGAGVRAPGKFASFANMTPAGPRWTGRVELVPSKLDEPLRWRKPRRVFVNSMSDLFHERLAEDSIGEVFEVMAAAPQHIFQILTKRAEGMRDWVRSWTDHENERGFDSRFRHVWLGVSVEDQATADERVPLLLQTPAAVRFVSYEPALAAVNLEAFLSVYDRQGEPSGPRCNTDGSSQLSWLIVGGESGPGARPFDLAWARSVLRQCREAGVPVFVKQLGAKPRDTDRCESCLDKSVCWCVDSDVHLKDAKGGDPAEWPEDLGVREFPEMRA